MSTTTTPAAAAAATTTTATSSSATTTTTPTAAAAATTNHCVYYSASPAAYYLISTLSTRGSSDCSVIAIDPATGVFHYRACAGVDLFPSEAEAVRALEATTTPVNSLKLVDRFQALLGCVHTHSSVYLAVVKSATVTMRLPPSHLVHSVDSAQWLKLPLTWEPRAPPQQHQPFNPSQPDGGLSEPTKALLDLDLSDLYLYYSETFDMTHPYPNVYHVHNDMDLNFVWNDAITTHFRHIGLGHICVVALQGVATHVNVNERDLENEAQLGIILRREILNPATRHLGRGLNNLAGAGNEAEMEVIMWTLRDETYDPSAAEQHLVVSWSSVLYRRGTVPLRWRTEVMGTAITLEDRPNRDTPVYWQRLLARYGTNMVYNILSLLYNTPSKPNEKNLNDAYVESVDSLKSQLNMKLSITQFDWHSTFHKFGLDETATQLYRTMMKTVKSNNITAGRLRYTTKEQRLTHWEYDCRQKGILRINCLDSLDRTNMVIFLLTLKVVPEMCRYLGVDHFKEGPYTMHSTPPWPLSGKTLDTLKQVYGKGLMRCLVTLFIAVGDMLSGVYTGSPAMFTQHIRNFTSDLPSASPDAIIGIRRKISNVFEDKKRTMQHEALLGMVPCVSFVPIQQLLSFGPGGAAVINTPNLADECSTSRFLDLNDPTSSSATVVPYGVDRVEVVVSLPSLSMVTDLVLTMPKSGSSSGAPVELDMFVGQCVDDVHPVFQGVRLPRTGDGGASLQYQLPSHISGVPEKERVCPFYGEGEPVFVRVVVLVFWMPKAQHIRSTFGSVQVYGVMMRANPCQFRIEAQERLNAAMDDVSRLLVVDSAPHVWASDRDDACCAGIDVATLTSLYGVVDAPQDSDDDDDWDEVACPTLLHPATAGGNGHGGAVVGSGGSFNTMATVSSSGSNAEEYRRVREFLHFLEQFSASYPLISFTSALEIEEHRLRLGVSDRRRDTCFVMSGYAVGVFDPNALVVLRDRKVEEGQRERLRSNMCSNTACRKPLTFLSRTSCAYCRMSYCSRCATGVKTSIVEFDWPTASYTLCQTCRHEVQRQHDLISEIHRLHLQMDSMRKSATRNMHDAARGSALGGMLCFPSTPASRTLMTSSLPETTSDAHVQWLRQHGVLERQQKVRSLGSWSTESRRHNVSSSGGVILTTSIGINRHDGPPLDVILEPNGRWRARDGVRTVDFTILLPSVFDVDAIVFHAPGGGHKREGAVAQVSVDAGPTMTTARMVVEGVPLPLDEDTTLSFDFPVLARLLHIVIDVESQEHVDLPTGVTSTTLPAVRLGHVEVLGTYVSGSTASVLGQRSTPEESSGLPQPQPQLLAPPGAVVVVPSHSQRYLPEHRILHVEPKQSVISGFRLEGLHRAHTLSIPQVRVVRIFLLMSVRDDSLTSSSTASNATHHHRGQTNNISQQCVGDYTIPRTRAADALEFGFPQTFSGVCAVRFEFLQLYETTSGGSSGDVYKAGGHSYHHSSNNNSSSSIIRNSKMMAAFVYPSFSSSTASSSNNSNANNNHNNNNAVSSITGSCSFTNSSDSHKAAAATTGAGGSPAAPFLGNVVLFKAKDPWQYECLVNT
eukprot:PhM_4_TR8422/c0_g1_i2/m.103626